VANKCLDAHGGGDCNQLRSYINCIIVELIAISSDRVSMYVDGGFDGGFDDGFDGWLHLAVLGYQPQQSV
jgi:hypothetical protein